MAIRESYSWLSRSRGDGLRLTRRSLTVSALVSVLRGQKPETGAFDLSLLDEGVIPNELFFVREHFAAPAVASQADWVLTAGPARFSYEELLALPSRVVPATLECAENPVGGGLAGHAEWTGVPLAALLTKAGTPGRFARLSGADGFSRCVPIAKALHPDTLIAYSMNGEKLPASHGFPLRAIVPGWYGMDSIKWLRSVELLAEEDPPRGYLRLVKSLLAGAREDGRVGAIQVKSVFSRPLEGAVLSGRRFLIRGVAWGGESRVKQVEVSVDGEKTWHAAKLTGAVTAYGWTHWVHDWRIARAGEYRLAVRATDEAGAVQPSGRASGRVDGYEWDAWQRIAVTAS